MLFKSLNGKSQIITCSAKKKGALPMQKLVAFAITLSVCGCAVHNGSKPHLVRLRFVPVDTHVEDGGGANWSRLSPAPDRPGALWATAHAGLGDEFPVQDQDGRVLFDVVVPEATDDHFVLKVRSADGSKTIDLRRDKPLTVQVAEASYEFYYPTCKVSSAGKTTTHKAMVIVTRLP